MERIELLSVGDDLIKEVKNVFPMHAEYEPGVDRIRGYTCCIYWKLNNDKDRLHKLSRHILIIITSEAIESSNYEERKGILKERFREVVEEKYKDFNPNHESSKDQLPPTEEWIVDSSILR